MANSGHRLPIFRDEMSFDDRHGRSFRDMHRRMEEDLQRAGFGKSQDTWPKIGGGGSGFGKLGGGWDDDFDKMCKDFFELKPRPRRVGDIVRSGGDDFGSRESLDDKTVQNLYHENPDTKGRLFQISFDVKDYEPSDISVKVKDDTMLVEARHEDLKEGNKNVREFNRKIKIPEDVDPDRLESHMSADGILTVFAPVPPKYQSVVYVNKNDGTNGGALQRPTSRSPQQYAPAPAPHTYASSPPPPQSPQGYAPGQGYASPPPSQGYTSPPPSQGYTSPPPLPAHQPSPGYASPPAAPQMYSQVGGGPPMPPAYPPGSYSSPPPPPPSYGAMPTAFSPEPAAGYAFTVHSPPTNTPMDTPTYQDTESGRKMFLMLEVGKPYTPEDLMVKLEGLTLVLEAVHEELAQGKTSKSSMSRNFELTEEILPTSVQAMLRSDGKLVVTADVKSSDKI